MSTDKKSYFMNLNRESSWPEFHWEGVELLEDGSLQLYSLPRLERTTPEDVRLLPSPEAPTGIAIANDGIIYFSDPSGHRIMKHDPCDEQLGPVPCFGGFGERPTQFKYPRGMLFHRRRRALFVVDSGNHRIQIFDPYTFQLQAIWGKPGSGHGQFNTPWTLAEDSDGSVYIVDKGNLRVQKFDRFGKAVPSFWNGLSSYKPNLQPLDVAIGQVDQNEELYVLASTSDGQNPDRLNHEILVLDFDGHIRHSIDIAQLQDPMGFSVVGDALYIGDNHKKRVLKFLSDGRYLGETLGYEGPSAALAAGDTTELWVHTGGMKLLKLNLRSAFALSGVIWSKAIGWEAQKVLWHRFKAIGQWQPNGSHIQFFYSRASSKTAAPPDPDVTNLETPFDKRYWDAFPLDSADNLILGDPSNYLWVGAHLTSEGLFSPRLQQLRVQYDHPSYSAYLPAIYRAQDEGSETLERSLGLFQSFFEDLENNIHDLPKLFDYEAAPGEWLLWLADWLGLYLDENWSLAKMRDVIAQAYEMLATRGSALGLKRTIKLLADIDVHIEEPILQSSWWVLPETDVSQDYTCMTPPSSLGFNTMLVVAEPQGAVVGTSAKLDQSHLILQDETGSPLFEDVSHQFSVLVYKGQVDESNKMDQLRALIDREKPAHTSYHLCVITSQMRVGFQARVGIDTLIAGPPIPSKLDSTKSLADKLVLGGETAGIVGFESQIGINTRLSDFPENIKM